ncbi:MAG: hypothetical protein O7B35_09870, partial [Deltaproteobacteria bacterium]|nr:hypothetical protein [Deltaproteobacteria bacterium]
LTGRGMSRPERTADKRMGEAQASDSTTNPNCLNFPLFAAIILFVSTPGVASGPLIVGQSAGAGGDRLQCAS